MTSQKLILLLFLSNLVTSESHVFSSIWEIVFEENNQKFVANIDSGEVDHQNNTQVQESSNETEISDNLNEISTTELLTSNDESSNFKIDDKSSELETSSVHDDENPIVNKNDSFKASIKSISTTCSTEEATQEAEAILSSSEATIHHQEENKTSETKTQKSDTPTIVHKAEALSSDNKTSNDVSKRRPKSSTSSASSLNFYIPTIFMTFLAYIW